MPKYVLSLVAVLILVPAAFAQTTTNTGLVTANVVKNCTVSAFTIPFGAYDPVGVNSGAAAHVDRSALDALTVTCTKGVPYTVALSNGASFGLAPGFGTNRAMLGAILGDFLGFEIYSNSVAGTPWYNAPPVGRTSTSKAPFSHSLFARLFGGQDVSADTYSETITATLNY